MTRPSLGAYATLVACGAGWGLTQPLTKTALDGGWQPLGILFWSTMIVVAILMPVALRQPWPADLRPALAWGAVVGVMGTLVPNTASFTALVYLPSGIVSILISTIPILALPIAAAMRLERPTARRLLGLLVGFAGVLILVAPGARANAPLHLLPLGLIAPVLYALQNNLIAKFGTFGLSPVQLMATGSAVTMVLCLPLSHATGQFRWPGPVGIPEGAILLSSAIHAVVYTTFVALVGRTGPVFSTQVGYLVTLSGVFWAMLLLGERYGWSAFLAMAVIFAGVTLVRPAPASAPASAPATAPSNPRAADARRAPSGAAAKR